jgi:branched-subunit amino acid aminotransferase/4-amino-4-deoxychorismate lyase
MTNRQYINYNGKFFATDEPVFGPENRLFCYGDGIFETIRCNAANLLHFDDHYERLECGMEAIKLKKPGNFNKTNLAFEIEKVITKNRIFKGGRIRLSIFRKTGGFYTPRNNIAEYLVEAKPIDNEFYTLNENGLNIGLFTGLKKPVNALSNHKTSNSLIYVLAGIEKNQRGWDDAIILNEKNRIIESATSNVFIVGKGILFTPPLSDGGIAGIMRKQILSVANKLQIPVKETSMDANTLEKADEILLTNAINGIKWVLGIKHKRYFHKMAKVLNNALNKETFG